MLAFIRRLADDESGVTAVEYSLICALMGLVMVVSLHDIGPALNATFGTLSHALAGH